MKNIVGVLLAFGFALSPLAALADGPPPLGQEAKAILQAHCTAATAAAKRSRGVLASCLTATCLSAGYWSCRASPANPISICVFSKAKCRPLHASNGRALPS